MSEIINVKKEINAPIEKVWSALTDKNEMKKWYFHIPDFELKEGTAFNFYEPGDEKKYHHQCEILELVPDRRFKHTWSYPDFSDAKTIVTWELEPTGNATLVSVTHENLDSFSNLGKEFGKESFQEGWNEIVGKMLPEFLE